MALQIRRGIESERTAGGGVVFAEGELVYITDTDKLYIGDNTTAGGIEIGPKTLSELGAVSLSGNLTLGGNNIVGTGNINITGDIQASGNITAGGNIDIGDAAGDTLTITAQLDSGITPNADSTYDLGSTSLKWNTVHAAKLDGDVSGSVFADDSTLLVDAVNNIIPSAVVSGTEATNWNTAYGWGDHSTQNYIVDGTADAITATMVAEDVITSRELADGNSYNGTFDGDITGSVFADNSTLLVDGVNGTIPATVISGTLSNDTSGTAAIATAVDVGDESADTTCFPMFGTGATGTLTIKTDQSAYTYDASTGTLSATAFAGNITGDVTGDVAGNLTGNVFTNLIDSADSSAIVVTPSLQTLSDVQVDQDLRVGSGNTEGPNGTDVRIVPAAGGGVGRVLADTIEVKNIEIQASDGGEIFVKGNLDISGSLTTNGGHLGFGGNDLLTFGGTSASLRVAEFTGDFDQAGDFENAANFNNYMTVNSTVADFGTAVQFASMTTTQRNALTAAAGMVVFNTTDTKLQVYTGSAWADLH